MLSCCSAFVPCFVSCVLQSSVSHDVQLQVNGDGQYERISGSSLGGGTFWGLCRLLTQRRDFDDMLELSMQGNNANVRAERGKEMVGGTHPC